MEPNTAEMVLWQEEIHQNFSQKFLNLFACK